jgi:hypothetical protein
MWPQLPTIPKRHSEHRIDARETLPEVELAKQILSMLHNARGNFIHIAIALPSCQLLTTTLS